MPIDPEKFQRSLMEAARLCEPSAEEKMRNIERQKRGAIGQGLTADMGVDGGIYDNTQFLTEAPQQSQYSQTQALTETARIGMDPLAVDESKIKNSKLPPAILAHLQKTEKIPMDPRLLAEAGISAGDSVLSGIMPKQASAPVAPPTVQHVPVSSGIDYSVFRAIINECLDAKLKEYSKQTLTEGTLKTIGLKEGKIRLVDNSGNIYSAKLEKTGNINDKKK